MTTVLTVPPLLLGATGISQMVMSWMCQRYATTGGRVQVPVSTKASLARDAVVAGVDTLDRAIRGVKGDMIVFGHSQGAQIAGEWVRKYAGDRTAPGPDRLRFILTGNPQRGRAHGAKGGGTSLVDGSALPDTPNNARWTVWDIARAGDKYADPLPGVLNGMRGGGIHTFGYFGLDLDVLPPPVEIVGNTHYFVVP